MKKAFFIAIVLTMIAAIAISAKAESNESSVMFPLGLTGFEDIEQAAAALEEEFGDGIFQQDEEYRDFVINPENAKMYDLDVLRVVARQKDKNANVIAYLLKGTMDYDGAFCAMNLLFDLNDKYGTPWTTTPVNQSTDVDGNIIYYTISEEIKQVIDAILDNKPFEYKSIWVSHYGENDEIEISFGVTVKNTKNGEFSVTLIWVNSTKL